MLQIYKIHFNMKNGTIWQHIYSIENARKFKNTAFLKIFLFFSSKSFKGLKNFFVAAKSKKISA